MQLIQTVENYLKSLETTSSPESLLTLMQILEPFKHCDQKLLGDEQSDWVEIGCFASSVHELGSRSKIDPVLALEVAYALGFENARKFQQQNFGRWLMS